MKKFKDIMTIIIGFSILLAITYGFIFFFGGAIFSVLGLKYKSIWSLAKFIAIYMIIALPIDFIIYTFFKIVRQVKNISTQYTQMLQDIIPQHLIMHTTREG